MSMTIRKTIALFLLTGAAAGLQAADLATPEQKLSYTLGAQSGATLKQQEINVDQAAFMAGLADALKGAQLQVSQEEMKEAMKKAREEMIQRKKEKAEAAAAAGKKFLEENKGKPGVVALENGLQYTELTAGKGDSPTADSKVIVHYRGTLIDGKEFDSSYGRGQPASFNLKQVIPGFREALTRMKPGSKWKIFVPSEMGYGMKGTNNIGPNETLIFEIELISFEAAPPAPAAPSAKPEGAAK